MNLVYKLMQKFFKEEWVAAIGIVSTSILLTLYMQMVLQLLYLSLY